jgi:molybdenum transport protein
LFSPTQKVNDTLGCVDYKNENFADVKLLATGGININNVEEYAKTQVDAIVTSSMYSCGMANLGSKISLI